MQDWWIYRGTGHPHSGILRLPAPPPWRAFDGAPLVPPPSSPDSAAGRRLGELHRAVTYQPRQDEVDLVNAALYLRRPLLITGKPGVGKSTLAYAVAHELALGPVLRWSITSRAALATGLYSYDAIGRLQEASLHHQLGTSPDSRIGRYLRLGPLGTALLPYEHPRVLLIDEIDKSDVDLPDDLLNVFEEGEYAIPELQRIAAGQPSVDVPIEGSDELVTVHRGVVRCHAFPLVVMTSNGEREFSPAFHRRCLRLDLGQPSAEQLSAIVAAHFGTEPTTETADLIELFLGRRERGTLATDQLLNAVYLTVQTADGERPERDRLADLVLRQLDAGPDS
ncbi:MoxR family ATPase [Micromonospora sp. WMMD980]|uniref:AAA family ATPase n=1 Tax=Micromonospora sp. WMMD980 TaxID=3016088 RepID=UPI002417C576|nr:MoxR family ATPase [Micromonospora sp. WMMD980]MDG4802376.1 MoxR family ATPase [Micromonospora sp. WMMD980]